MTDSPNLEALSFEAAMQQLADILARLESGDLPLQESLELYERGVALSRQCQAHLDQAELRVVQLDEDGTPHDFELGR